MGNKMINDLRLEANRELIVYDRIIRGIMDQFELGSLLELLSEKSPGEWSTWEDREKGKHRYALEIEPFEVGIQQEMSGVSLTLVHKLRQHTRKFESTKIRDLYDRVNTYFVDKVQVRQTQTYFGSDVGGD